MTPSELSTSATKSERLQMLLAVLLGAAALATAWAAYRGDLYSGDSVIMLNQSVQTADRANQALNRAETVFVQDVGLFTQFAMSANRDESNITAYLQTSLMRDELQEQVEWWSGQDVGVVETPFVDQNPHYVPPTEDATARELRARSAEEFREARKLDSAGDEYVLYTVLFAAALFMYGIASVASSRRVLIAGIGVGGALFAFSMVMMIAIDAPPLL